jgi:hypothetical protein
MRFVRVCCLLCAGQYQASLGQPNCKPCERGTFSTVGLSSCSQCSFGTQQPYLGGSTCFTCPPNSISDSYRTSCTCQIGYYMTSENEWGLCEPCTRGMVCTREGIQLATVIAANGSVALFTSGVCLFVCFLRSAHVCCLFRVFV